MVDQKKIGLIVYDFDGVLTNNQVLTNQDGAEAVFCNRSDGWWINEIKKMGLEQIILSTEKNPVVSMRAKKIGLEAHQGFENKHKALVEIAKKKNIPLEQICYIGNDVNDAECMRTVGFSICPQDSHSDILKIAKIKLSVNGGAGVAGALYQWLNAGSEKTKSDHRPSESSAQKIKSTIAESIRVKQELLSNETIQSQMSEIASAMTTALKNGKKIVFAGNGGSFADSMHLAAEFVSKLCIDRAPLASIALGTSNSNLTAIGNDYGYEHSFSREIRALGQQGDIFIAISTSGNSPNILHAVKSAKEKGMIVYGWSGKTGGKLSQECTTIQIPSTETARIQECHIMIGHIISEIAEESFLP